MKRKRVVKLLMSVGVDRNVAEHRVRNKPRGRSNEEQLCIFASCCASPLRRVNEDLCAAIDAFLRNSPLIIDEMRWYHRSSN